MLSLFSFKFIPLWTFKIKDFDSTTLNFKLMNTSKQMIQSSGYKVHNQLYLLHLHHFMQLSLK